ncbi:hypothetical protein CPB84DRAFT_1492497 [Gymnopilus junonius]|uniref:Uncharacterized protein n=1 Tax=Gymnopilus junonius TaxID=109634 RepID=A0A9P5NJR3_GYMJU|nr:hypothetical protein CPB84DRAFT_1492497 [Gymnopilus junonius]
MQVPSSPRMATTIRGYNRRELSITVLPRLLPRHARDRDLDHASYEDEPTEDPETNGSITSLDCLVVESEYEDDSFDTESPDQASMDASPPSPAPSLSIILPNESDTETAHMLLVSEQHSPTWASRNPSSTSLAASMPTSEDESHGAARFNALMEEVEKVSRTIVSRHVEESDLRLREELQLRRTSRHCPSPGLRPLFLPTLEVGLGRES